MKKTREYTVCDLCKNKEETALYKCLVCGKDTCSFHRREWEPHQGGNGPLIVRAKINVCDLCLPSGFVTTPIVRKINDVLVRAFDDIQFELNKQYLEEQKTQCSSS